MVPISTTGCYTTLRPPDSVEEDDVETLRVEHHFADPYWAFGRWTYFPYGYGAAGALYLYDPYYDYYYGDPWWYLPDEGEDEPPPPRGPVVGTIGDAPPPPPRVREDTAPAVPATAAPAPPERKTRRRKAQKAEEETEVRDGGTVSDAPAVRRNSKRIQKKRPDAD
ncbi:MAG: hypothetical protein CME06_10755 [Gemmatimonadetes bacterium]|nr:hypothetical protein [Gemmatimonadota bacterium]